MSRKPEEQNTHPTAADAPQSAPAQTANQSTGSSVQAADVFSSELTVNTSEEEVFVGDLSFLKDLTAQREIRPGIIGDISAPLSRTIYMILGANILLMLIVVAVIWFQPAKVVNFRVVPAVSSEQKPAANPVPSHVSDSARASAQNQPAEKSEFGTEALSEVLEKTVVPAQQESLKQGISLKTADGLFAAGKYLEASYVYHQIGLNWIASTASSQYFRDYLKLRMAVSLHRAGQAYAQEECFAQALESRSAYVRGMASYYLARIHFQNQEYLEARQRAYQAIALCKAFEDMLTTNLEVDLYFLAAESLTRQVVGFYNMEQQFPGRDWSDSLVDIWPAEPDALRLEEALSRTAERIGEGAANPRLTVDTNRPVSSQWSLIALNSPLEETLWKVTSQANLNAVWEGDLSSIRNRPVTVYMTYISQQYATETLCGIAGLIWNFDGQKAAIFNPNVYTDFESHRGKLIGEAISIWQRFLLRYRDDKRIANVHYALGRLYTFAGQSAAALGEFKLLQGRFPQNTLAPYAYLEASKIKVDLKDYEGAAADLNEMLLQYPDCPVVDEATIYLARTALESGQTERAKELFRKSYQMNLSRAGKCEALYGLGRCTYVQQDWNETQTWLSKALELIEDKNDSRIGSMCFMLGRAYTNSGQYDKAAKAFRTALNSKLSENEYMQTILKLVDAECRQQNFFEAISILENVPQGRLGQEDACDLLIAKARILREIGVLESAISLLRKKIEFVADSRLRAKLTLELAVCHLAAKDYSLARRELSDVLPNMPDSYYVRQANLVLAQITEKLGQPAHTENLCLSLLNDPQIEEDVRAEAFSILGRIYTSQKYYDKAALAFAGILPQKEGRP